MQLVASYLIEVGRYLPAGQRDDILAELRSSVEEQVLDAAGEREPSEADERAVLNTLGHPMRVASNYQTRRYLIGPELYPTFVQTLKTVLIIVTVIQLGLMLTAYVSGGWTTSTFGLIKGVFDTLLWFSVVVLIVFVVMEYSGERLDWYDSWKAETLRPVPAAPIDFQALIINLVSEAIFLLWWNDVLPLQNRIPGYAERVTVELTPLWEPWFWPLNLIVGLWFMLHVYVFVRGLWTRETLWAEIGLGVTSVAIGLWLIGQSPLVAISGGSVPDTSVIPTLVVKTVIAGILLATLWDMWLARARLYRPPTWLEEH